MMSGFTVPDAAALEPLPFLKMHGLGNDFVIVDARRRPVALDAARARAIADRRLGVGCDQVIVIEPPARRDADAFMRIRNADGGEANACGNASRCVAAVLMREKGSRSAMIETAAGLLRAEAVDGDGVAVDMGPACFAWADIPLAAPADTLHLSLDAGPLGDGVAVSMGNPHVVFFVDRIETVDPAACGPAIERHPLFPERTNVEFVQVLANDRLRLRVWERGVGITRACGSGACAAVVAASRRGIAGRSARVELDGGTLDVVWCEDGHVIMTGPAATSFTGLLDPSLLT
jgi:diaminopimelate epimerase